MFESYIKAQNQNIVYCSYDNFRSDEYKKHAPFDGLIYESSNQNIHNAIAKINADVENDSFGRVSDQTFEWIRKHKIYTVEIKSSKIPEKDFPGTIFNSWDSQKKLINNLRKRDLFFYPKYNRTGGKEIHNFQDYIDFVRQKKNFSESNFLKELIKSELASKCDIYFRIFIDKNSTNKFIAYILGYTLKETFFQSPKIINMPGGKSGNAIYFAFPIEKSKSLSGLLFDKDLW
jgi:hypothetical protein